MKSSSGSHRQLKRRAGELDHFVAFAVAVGVVEGLEVVEVAIAGDERGIACSRRSICSLIGTLPGSSVSGLA